MERDKEEETGRGMQGSRQGEGRGGEGKGRKESSKHQAFLCHHPWGIAILGHSYRQYLQEWSLHGCRVDQ